MNLHYTVGYLDDVEAVALQSDVGLLAAHLLLTDETSVHTVNSYYIARLCITDMDAIGATQNLECQ